MGMKTIVGTAAVICSLILASTAVAGGWAGSRYDKADCTYNTESDMVFCEAWFTEESFTTENLGLSDLSCPSTIRMIERTGWRVTTYRGWGIFFGRVPVHHKEFAGNEDSFADTWRDYTDVDQGCLPSG